MPLTELDHYFVRSGNLKRSLDFYRDVLGFEVMPRPDFPFPGYWLGVAGKVQVHLGPDGIAEESEYYFGTSPRSARDNSGVIDHIAFQASEPEIFARRLHDLALPVRSRYIPEIQLFQIFLADPDGVMIELNFPGIDEEPALAAI